MARVTLGNLLLENLGQPDQALHHFNQYLSSEDRSLAQECLFGKARALNALRRYDEERTALESFIRRFPNGIQIQKVRERLRVIESAIPNEKKHVRPSGPPVLEN
jgi:tetratricopeptide (TPR) repeat protein